MVRPPLTSDRAHNHLATRGLTLLECMLAIAILAASVLGITYATNAGHQHLSLGDRLPRAARLAEHLMDEIESRPYNGSGGASRSGYFLDDFDGYSETSGSLRDFTGALYDNEFQQFARSVVVAPGTETIAELGGAVIPGKYVTITISDADDDVFVLHRFITEHTP